MTSRSCVMPCGSLRPNTAREFEPRNTRLTLFQPNPKCRWTQTKWPEYDRSDVALAMKRRPLRLKPIRGATLTVTGWLSAVRQWVWYVVRIVGVTLNVYSPFVVVVTWSTDCVLLPNSCAVRVTGSFGSAAETLPVSAAPPP